MNEINKITKPLENKINKTLKELFEKAKADNVKCRADTYWTCCVGHITDVTDECIFLKDSCNNLPERQFFYKDMPISEIYFDTNLEILVFYVSEYKLDEYVENVAE